MSYLSRNSARAIDRRAIEEFGVSGLVLMENAGRGCADLLDQLGVDGPVLVCCGKGNNGGDGFVIARHLDIRGYPVTIWLCCQPTALRGDAAANFDIVRRSGIAIRILDASQDDAIHGELDAAAWCVDALLGTGASGEPRGAVANVIHLLNLSENSKLAVDHPSGLDCDSGDPATNTVRADHTCAFVAPKTGFANPAATPYLGQIHVVDIGAPRCLIDEMVK